MFPSRWRGARREIYCFRDQQGFDVDFVVPGSGGAVSLAAFSLGVRALPWPEFVKAL